MRVFASSPSTLMTAAMAVSRLALGVHGSIANCPYLGPVFPAPTNLGSSDTMKAAVANLTAAFETYAADPANNANGTSWSVVVFSTSDEAADRPLWENYHTAPNVNASFVSAVDGNTIYRLGSVTKIFTILTWLVERGDREWNTPITEFIPELSALAKKNSAAFDPIMDVNWDDVTIGGLASQMAGIVRDYGILGELTQEHNQTELASQGFPPAPSNQTPPCGEYYLCTRQQLFQGLSIVPPSWGAHQTPGYSNLGYVLLAYALEEATGRNFTNMLHENIINKLNLTNTYYAKPRNNALGVIPDGGEDGWAFDLGNASPTGNMYSSVYDIAKLGRAILANDLLPAAQTRRWLKPTALTSEFQEGVGFPWGVRRIPLPPPGTSGGAEQHRVVDAYGKAGSINAYQSLLVLVPDHGIGIAALLAGAWPGNANWDMADLIGSSLLPALEETARLQADKAYAGRYESSGSSGGYKTGKGHNNNTHSGGGNSHSNSTHSGGGGNTHTNGTHSGNSTHSGGGAINHNTLDTLNSSIVLSTDPTRPGLGVESWISNGTDMITVAVRYTLNYNVTQPAIRLYPTGLESTAPDGSRRQAWKAVVENLDAPDQAAKMFSTDCGSWVSQTAAVYADMPLDQFVFALDPADSVRSVTNLALRATLDKSTATAAPEVVTRRRLRDLRTPLFSRLL